MVFGVVETYQEWPQPPIDGPVVCSPSGLQTGSPSAHCLAVRQETWAARFSGAGMILAQGAAAEG